jgi:hypothetical protein
MSSTCELVAERIALGEPLGDAGEHAATCERCKRLVALPVELGVTHREVDPGLGFSARMTAGAQHRIVVRRRRRIAGVAAAAVAVATLGVFAFTRDPAAEQQVAQVPPNDTQTQMGGGRPDPWDTSEQPDEGDEGDDDLRALVQLADTDRASRFSADWEDITTPVAPYRALLRGVSHE